MNILINVLLAIYVLDALLMVLVILMQRPKSEGLGAAFGGGMTENLFGAQTTNVLTKFTGWLAAVFFFLTFILSILYAHKGNAQSSLRGALMKGQPIAPAAAGTVPSASPGPSSAVGPPGTVTNLAPVTNPGGSAVGPSPNAADMAVGAAPAPLQPPENAPATAAPSAAGSPPKP